MTNIAGSRYPPLLRSFLPSLASIFCLARLYHHRRRRDVAVTATFDWSLVAHGRTRPVSPSAGPVTAVLQPLPLPRRQPTFAALTSRPLSVYSAQGPPALIRPAQPFHLQSEDIQ